jgi:hypothetical protein
MECLSNTEIAVHDGGNRVASLMYFQGDNTNNIIIGRDMGWGVIPNVDINGKVFLHSEILNINAAEWSSGGSKGLNLRSGYDVPNNNNNNYRILTYDHLGDGFCDGLSINGWDGIRFCTGSHTRNERMIITNAGNVVCTGSIGCVGVSASGGMRIGSSLGIPNTNPQSMLHLGNCEVINSAPVIILVRIMVQVLEIHFLVIVKAFFYWRLWRYKFRI